MPVARVLQPTLPSSPQLCIPRLAHPRTVLQAYPHKILTGRRSRMPTIRQTGGMSGFTNRSESEYDPFGAGHSSTSISAALGMAVARDFKVKDCTLPWRFPSPQPYPPPLPPPLPVQGTAQPGS